MEQFLSHKNYSWDTHTGFPFLWERRGEFRRLPPHGTVLILQELQLGHPHRVSFLVWGGGEVSLGGCCHMEQFFS